MRDTAVCLVSILIMFFYHTESLYIRKQKKDVLHEDEEFSQFERRQRVSGFLEVHGSRFESLGCWKDAWARALPSLEGEHYLLMEPNYKGRTHALFKCARAAREKKFRLFGLENGGQCFGSGSLDTKFKKYGPAKDCQEDGRGGPWSMEVYRFDENLGLNNRGAANANYGPWSYWSACSRTCGAGVIVRKRKCYGSQPSTNSSDCEKLGASDESLACNVKPCTDELLVGEVESDEFAPTYLEKKPRDEKNASGNGGHMQPYKAPKTADGPTFHQQVGKIAAESNIQRESGRLLQQIHLPQPSQSHLPQPPGQTLHNASNAKEGTMAMTGTLLQQYTGNKVQSLHPTGYSLNEHFLSSPAKVSLKHVSKQGETGTLRGTPGKATETSLLHNRPDPGVEQTRYTSHQVGPGDEGHVKTWLVDGDSPAPGLYKDYSPAPAHSPTLVSRNTSSKQARQPDERITSGLQGSQDALALQERIHTVKGNASKNQEEGSSDASLPNQSKHPGSLSVYRNKSKQLKEPDDHGSTPEDDVGETMPEGFGEPYESEMADQQEMQISQLKQEQKNNLPPNDHMVSQDIGQTSKPDNRDYTELHELSEMAKQDDQNVTERNVTRYLNNSTSLPQESPFNQTVPERQANLDSTVGKDQPNNIMEKPATLSSEKGTKMENHDTRPETDPENTHDDSTQCLCPSKVCSAKADLAFVVDSSADIPKQYFARVLEFIKALSRGFDLRGAHIGLVAYGRYARPSFILRALKDFTELDRVVDATGYIGGDLKTGNALLTSKTNLFALSSRHDALRALILLSSGSSSDDVTTPAEELRNAGVKVTAIGLGKLANVRELINAASEPKAEHVFTAFLDTLPNTMDDIVQGVCRDVLGILRDRIGPCPCASGPTAITVQIPPGQVKQAGDYTTNMNITEGSIQQGDSKQQPVSSIDTVKQASDYKTNMNRTEGSIQQGDSKQQPVSSIDTVKQASYYTTNRNVNRTDGSIQQEESKQHPVSATDTMKQASYNTTYKNRTGGSIQQGESKQHPVSATDTMEHASYNTTYKNRTGGLIQQGESKQQSVEGNPTQVLKPPPPGVNHVENIEGMDPGQNVAQASAQAGRIAEDWKQVVQSQEKPHNDSTGGHVPLPPVQVPIGKEAPPPGSSPHAPAFIPEPAVKPGDVMSLSAQNGAPVPLAYGASTNGTGNKTVPEPPAMAAHASTDNHTQGYQACGGVNLGIVLDSADAPLGPARENARKMMELVKKITHLFPVSSKENRVGMLVYTGTPQPSVVHFENFHDQQSMDKAIDDARNPNMKVKIGKALDFARDHLFKHMAVGKHNVLLLVTDGTSSDDVTKPAIELKRRNVEIFCFGVGDGVVKRELAAIASEPAQHHVFVSTVDQARSLLGSIRSTICRSANVFTNQNARRHCATDLEFLVDGSRSVEVLGRGNFRKVLEYVKNVTKDLNISPEGTRVGVSVYGSEPRVAVPMDKRSDSDSLARAIDRISYPATSKMTGRALKLAKKSLFDVGSRSNFSKVLVVLTTGTSKDSVKQSSADLHRHGVRVISVGLGPIHDMQELSDMASVPSAENIVLSRFQKLHYKVTDLQDRICRAALLKNTPN